MKEAGKTTYLEVVTYTEEGCMEGARLAGECGFDYLTGTVYYPAVMDVLKQYNMKYLPFPGKVGGSPVSLTGTIDEIVADSVRLIEAGADGVDLTSYRYTDGDPMELAYAVGRRIEMDKLTIAGSIGNTERMDKMNELGCKAYTMGSALFQGNFVKGRDVPRKSGVRAELSGRETGRMKHYVGIDMGTQSMLGYLFNPDGEMVAEASSEYLPVYPQPGWAECDANLWLKALKHILHEIKETGHITADDIGTVAFACIDASIVPVDENCDPIDNCIIWMDSRTGDQAARLQKAISGAGGPGDHGAPPSPPSRM